MINIICLITVTVIIHLHTFDAPVMREKQVRGHIIKADDEMYLVDFSKEAKEKGYVGDYEERMVQRSMCVRLK